MPTITFKTGKQFVSNADVSILDAAVDAGISLPYSCKTGRCNTCRGRVLSGETKVLHAEQGLTQVERDNGWILTCARVAVSDVHLDVQDLGDVVLPSVKTVPCRIASLKSLSSDVLEIALRFPPTVDFSFIPGQYVDIIGPMGIKRSYSIANANFSNKQLHFHIRQVPSGAMSDFWFQQAKVNDLLRLRGPLGTFFLRSATDRDIVFLATGTGIAPIKSMLDSLAGCLPSSLPRSVSLYWGGRLADDLYLADSDFNPSAKVIRVLSRADQGWSGARGHVQDVFLSQCSDLSNVLVYACGSQLMIESARRELSSRGLADTQFHSDAFVCSSLS